MWAGDVKEGGLLAFVPEILYPDVYSSTVLNIRASKREPLSTQRLELGFNTHIWAHFGEELSSDVSDGIVADGGHGTLGAAEGMGDAEGLATRAVRG